MRHEAGFSLIEVIITIVLLGLLAIGLVNFTYPHTSLYQNNVADLLAERKVEDYCRNISYTSLHSIAASSSNKYTVTTKGKSVDYYWWITVVGYDIGTISTTNPNNLTDSGAYCILTNKKSNDTTHDYDNSQVKLVTVYISLTPGGTAIARRSLFIAKP